MYGERVAETKHVAAND